MDALTLLKDVALPLVGTAIGAVGGSMIGVKVAVAVLNTEMSHLKDRLKRAEDSADHAHNRITDHVEDYHTVRGAR